MKRERLHDLTSDQLVDRFVLFALDQDKALLWNELAKFNALYRDMTAIERELKSRPGDQRRRLLELFSHSNIQVRLKAAEATLAVQPEAARHMLESIATSRKYPHAGHAGMTLIGLDRGEFTPT